MNIYKSKGNNLLYFFKENGPAFGPSKTKNAPYSEREVLETRETCGLVWRPHTQAQ